MAEELHRKYGFPIPRAEDLPQEEQYDWEPNDPLLEGVVTLADLYDRYAAKPFRENVMTDASPVVQKFKEVQGRIGGQDLPTDMILGMVDPQDPLTYLPGVGPALRAGMRTAKEAGLAAKNVANVARAAKGVEAVYPEAANLADLGVINPIAAIAKMLGISTKEAETVYLAEQAKKFAQRKPAVAITGETPKDNPFAKYMAPEGPSPLQIKQAEVDAINAEQAAIDAADLEKMKTDMRKRHVADSLHGLATRHWAQDDDGIELIPYRKK